SVASIALEQVKALDEKEFEEDKIKEIVHNVVTSTGIEKPQVMTIMRYIFTGIKIGAGVTGTIKTIGKEASLRRINKVLESFDSNIKA
ncbi:11182_t:CDS:2, partial [Acaulospora morrowiae]